MNEVILKRNEEYEVFLIEKSEMSCSSLQTPAVSSLDEEEEESTTSQFFEDNK